MKHSKGLATYEIFVWGEVIFFAAADLMMILRVYAMWNQSKWILCILLLIYVPQAIVSFVFTGIFDSSKTYSSVTTAQIGNFNTCAFIINDITLLLTVHLVDGSLRFVLSVALFMLAVIPTIKQSIDMFKVTKQWQPNKYMRQLVTDGILYFLLYVAFNITVILANVSISYNQAAWGTIMPMVCYMVIISMMPRFIISMRELYDRDCCSRWKGIDSGFGVLSQPTVSPNVVTSAIAFPDVTFRQGESLVGEGGADDPEVIQPETLGDGAHQLAEAEAENSQEIEAEDHAGHV
ncbi:hypothetical protein V8E55_009672 [Tylopilus felleus]